MPGFGSLVLPMTKWILKYSVEHLGYTSEAEKNEPLVDNGDTDEDDNNERICSNWQIHRHNCSLPFAVIILNRKLAFLGCPTHVGTLRFYRNSSIFVFARHPRFTYSVYFSENLKHILLLHCVRASNSCLMLDYVRIINCCCCCCCYYYYYYYYYNFCDYINPINNWCVVFGYQRRYQQQYILRSCWY